MQFLFILLIFGVFFTLIYLGLTFFSSIILQLFFNFSKGIPVKVRLLIAAFFSIGITINAISYFIQNQ